MLPTFSYHSYFSVWPLELLQKERQTLARTVAAVDPNLTLWQSEYCILEKNDEIGQGHTRDLGMDTALYVARIMHTDLTIANVCSWQWWTALTQCDYKDGLVYLDDGQGHCMKRGDSELSHSLMQDGDYHASKLLWTLGNYARFVRPGMVRIDCRLKPEQKLETGVLVSAYTNQHDATLVMVLTNQSLSDKEIYLPDVKIDRIYTTSASKNLQRESLSQATLVLSPRSITTLLGSIEKPQ